MDVRATTEAPAGTGADTIAVGLFEDEGIAHDSAGRRARARSSTSGEAKAGFRKLALTHADGKRWLVAGLGKRDEFDPERARIVAGGVIARARELGARSLCWELPHHVSDAHAAAFVEGSVMGAYEFTMFKSSATRTTTSGDGVAELIVSAHHDVAGPVETGRVVGESVNLTRDLQNRPANDLTPTALAERAREIAAQPRHAHARGDGPRRDRGGRHGRVRRRRAGHRGGAAADHAPLRRARARPARCSASSARP